MCKGLWRRPTFFAGAAGAYDAHHLAFVNVEVDAFEHLQAVETFRYPLNVYHAVLFGGLVVRVEQQRYVKIRIPTAGNARNAKKTVSTKIFLC